MMGTSTDFNLPGMDEQQIAVVMKKEQAVDPKRPTYTRMSRRHLSIETLNKYRIDYEFDVDPDYILIKRWVSTSHSDNIVKNPAADFVDFRCQNSSKTSCGATPVRSESEDDHDHHHNRLFLPLKKRRNTTTSPNLSLSERRSMRDAHLLLR